MRSIKVKYRFALLRLVVVTLLLFGGFSYAQVQYPAGSGESFKVRGFHLDLRVQVMKMPALREFALQLSKNGFNALIMEWEASYPYEKHSVITGQYAYSREEVKNFIDYCKSLNIDVIPLQQSFGHVEYILRHYRYKELREDQKDFSQVNPLKEAECKALFTDLFKDMIATHNSPYIHIGGDETYLLGHSEESKKKVAAVGKGRLYGDYIKMLCEVVISLGKRPVIWADIALNYPDALVGLPKETIFVDWNYGWALNRFGDHEQLAKGGFEVWGSPSIRSHPDNYFLTEWRKHFENIRMFIPQAKGLGYQGMVMTSWSTSGLYSAIRESTSDFIDLQAIRRVYPISGFRMLITAYFDQMKNTRDFNIDQFVDRYSRDTYGFDAGQAALFWTALQRAPYEVNQGKVSQPGLSIASLLDSARQNSRELQSLKPLKNKEEFAHYLLMSDIRVFYLSCILIESEMNSASYTIDRAPELLKRLHTLDPGQLNSRFEALNRHLLFAGEIQVENQLRNSRFELLKSKLSHPVK